MGEKVVRWNGRREDNWKRGENEEKKEENREIDCHMREEDSN